MVILGVPGGTFLLAGCLAVLTAFAIFRAIDALRGRDAVRACRYLVATLALATVTSGLAWLGTQHPAANFPGNADFGPDWECSVTGPTSSRVCLRNQPSPTSTRRLEDDQRRQALPGP
jgi:hypothetical protein